MLRGFVAVVLIVYGGSGIGLRGASATVPQIQARDAFDPLDWPYWRGPEYNGVSPETGLPDSWNPRGGEGSNLAWARKDLGGRSTPIVMRGRLYTLVRDQPETPTEGEKVVCLDAASGETLWENRFNVYLSDVPDTRVGWSSVVGDPATGNVFAHGVCGEFRCIDGATGETQWRVPLHEQFGALSTYGGRTNFPVICDDLVIVSAIVIGWGDMAKPAHRFIAFDKHTGKVVWFRGTRPLPYDTTYSGPTLATLQGQKAIVFGSGDGAVWALQARTGKEIWQFRLARRGLNATPLVVDHRVYAGNGEENLVGTSMGSLVAIDARQQGDVTESGQLWRVDELVVGRTQPLLIDGRLWVFDDRAKLHVLNAETGERITDNRGIRLGTVMRASPLYVDGKVYAMTANGRWYILQPDQRRGAKILQKGRFASGVGCHASPICSHGRIYLATTTALYCLKDDTQIPAARLTTQTETPSPASSKPAQAQIVPAEILAQPGQTHDLELRWYNAAGDRVSDAAAPSVTWDVEGPAQVDANGQLKIDSSAAHEAVFVTVKAGDITAQSRVRVVPPLPWSFDFDDISISQNGKGAPPITWVGARYRHIIRSLDGNQVMVKITTIPKGARSRCWFGHPNLADYTVQADVRGSLQDGKMPDIGLIAQGYAIDLQGASQKLQIRTWVTEERMARAMPFAWKPDRWYTMQLRVENSGTQATVRGKVWPRDQAEPEEWTLVATDDAPNRFGSPGLYGNAKDAEILLDNIVITPND